MDEPEHLYHYTSPKGLLGILRSGKLRMTSILYLNDRNEFEPPMNLFREEFQKCFKESLDEKFTQKGINIFKESLDEKLTQKGIKIFKGNIVSSDHFKLAYDIVFQYYSNMISRIVNDMVSKVVQGKDIIRQETIKKLGVEVFIFSLSAKGDNLNQWRGYCPDTGGVCIGFDGKKLYNIVDKKDHLVINKCLYEDDKKLEEIKNVLREYLPDHKTNIRNWIEKGDRNIVNKLFLHMIIKCSSIKDKSFIDEEEYRMVYFNLDENITFNIQFNEGEKMITPYYEYELKDEDDKLPISKIIIGPTPHPELSKLSVERLLKSEKYEGVEVEISKIPYRPW
jgi:hypothetical protein